MNKKKKFKCNDCESNNIEILKQVLSEYGYSKIQDVDSLNRDKIMDELENRLKKMKGGCHE